MFRTAGEDGEELHVVEKTNRLSKFWRQALSVWTHARVLKTTMVPLTNVKAEKKEVNWS